MESAIRYHSSRSAMTLMRYTKCLSIQQFLNLRHLSLLKSMMHVTKNSN